MKRNVIYPADHTGKNLAAVLPSFPENSIDAVVTDPPYELGFMGKSWDASGVTYSVDFWREVLRVMKPGAHLLAFGGTRTYHRMACAIEDAGFEIRDQIQWLYGSGFPKSMDVAKALDKAAGVNREDKFEDSFKRRAGPTGNKKCEDCGKWLVSGSPCKCPRPQDEPQSAAARQWAGWGTALKPANEPIVLARKPLSEKTVAANVLKWGVGGLNIDGARIPVNDDSYAANCSGDRGHGDNRKREMDFGMTAGSANKGGRFPANVILDTEAGALLDAQSGERKAGSKVKGTEPSRTGDNGIYSAWGRVENTVYEDTGGASRFFYHAKASQADRSVGGVENIHPTVKPTALMRYLVRMVTPPKGLVLDPFMGSGSTGRAAVLEGFDYVGCEMGAEYIAIAEKRIAAAVAEREKEVLGDLL